MTFRIGRREFITLLGGAAAAWPLSARAQQSGKPLTIGFMGATPSMESQRVAAFVQRLRELGWVDGRNLAIEYRWAEGRPERVSEIAAEFVRNKVDVIVTVATPPTLAAKQATAVIPIVFAAVSDPVGTGLVASLARPGGNVTGFTFLELSMFGKMLETLKQIAPATVRVAFMYNPDNPNTAYFRHSFETALGPLAIELVIVTIHGLADIERALSELADRGNGAVFVPPDVTLSALRAEVVTLVARHRLPAIYSDPAFPKIGGLAFYGADRLDLFRRTAGDVDRILRGEKPGDLPFQQPTKYQLILNLKTAKALGIELSPTLLALADEVIE
jgi:putative tryptophan/tyrosine transport system substrate-binding protein